VPETRPGILSRRFARRDRIRRDCPFGRNEVARGVMYEPIATGREYRETV
jgi:hypothetical protein